MNYDGNPLTRKINFSMHNFNMKTKISPFNHPHAHKPKTHSPFLRRLNRMQIRRYIAWVSNENLRAINKNSRPVLRGRYLITMTPRTTTTVKLIRSYIYLMKKISNYLTNAHSTLSPSFPGISCSADSPFPYPHKPNHAFSTKRLQVEKIMGNT